MKRTVTIAAFVALAISVLAAQAPPQMPKPGPEHQRLRYFLGEWKSEADMKPGPYGPGGKLTSTDHNTMLGDFFVVIHCEAQGPMGAMKEVATLGYDPKEKVYTYSGYNSLGEHSTSKGTVSGGTWNWTNEEERGGKKIKGRFTLKEVSPTSYTYTFDSSSDGGPWTNMMEGKATKIK